ncbi:MAG: hypothetical protein OXC02_07070, partial [Rhodobacteraceae bacterium]|nr:hypothetical protein [Paracoccaceae bacterium]
AVFFSRWLKQCSFRQQDGFSGHTGNDLQQDGRTNNDCKQNFVCRFLKAFRCDQHKRKIIIRGEGLYSKGSFIKRLQDLLRRCIHVSKDGNLTALYDWIVDLPSISTLKYHQF